MAITSISDRRKGGNGNSLEEREARNAEQYRQGQRGGAAARQSGTLQGNRNFLGSLLDIMDRPRNVLAGALYSASSGDDLGETFSRIGRSATGREHTSPSQILAALRGMEESEDGEKPSLDLPFGVSTVLDTAIDPTTYVSFGATAAARRGLQAAARELGQDVAEDIAKRGARKALTPDERAFLRRRLVQDAAQAGAAKPGRTADRILKELNRTGRGGMRVAGRTAISGQSRIGRTVRSALNAPGRAVQASETGRAIQGTVSRGADLRHSIGDEATSDLLREVRSTSDIIDARNAEVEAAARNVGRGVSRRGLNQNQRHVVLQSTDIASENEPLRQLRRDASEAQGAAERAQTSVAKSQDRMADLQERAAQDGERRALKTEVRRRAIEQERDSVLKQLGEEIQRVRQEGTMQLIMVAGTPAAEQIGKRVQQNIRKATDAYYKAVEKYGIRLEDLDTKYRVKAHEAQAKHAARMDEQRLLDRWLKTHESIQTPNAARKAADVEANANTKTALRDLRGESASVDINAGPFRSKTNEGNVSGLGPAMDDDALLQAGRGLQPDMSGIAMNHGVRATLAENGLPFSGWVDNAGRPTDQFWQMRQELKNALHTKMDDWQKVVNDAGDIRAQIDSPQAQVAQAAVYDHQHWLRRIKELESAKWLSADETGPAYPGRATPKRFEADPALAKVVEFVDKQRTRITEEQIGEGILKRKARDLTPEYIPRYVTKEGKKVLRDHTKQVSTLLGVPGMDYSDLERALLQGGRLKKRQLRPDLNIEQINRLFVGHGLLKDGQKFFDGNVLRSIVRRSIDSNIAVEQARMLKRITEINGPDGKPLLRAVKADEAYKYSDDAVVKMSDEVDETMPRYVGHPDVVRLLNDAAAMTINDASLKAFSEGVGRVAQIWRGLATLGPAYTMRNAVGNFQLNWLAGIKSPTVYARAAELQRILSAMYRSLGPDADIKALIRSADISEADKAILRGAVDHQVIGHGFFDVDLPHPTMQNRPETSLGSVGRVVKDVVVPGRNNYFLRANRTVNRAVENNARLAHYIYKVEELGSHQAASDSVKKFLFDYADLTATEKLKFKRFIPFYTFMRKNLPLQLEQAVLNPRKFTIIAHALSDMNEQGWEWKPDLPTSSVDDILAIFMPSSTAEERFQGLARPLAPGLKTVTEQASGASTFNGYPFRTTEERVETILRNLFPPFAKVDTARRDADASGMRALLKDVLGLDGPPLPSGRKKKDRRRSTPAPSGGGIRPISER